MKSNGRIFLLSAVTILIAIGTFIIFGLIFIKDQQKLTDGHIPLAFYIMIPTGFLVARVFIFYFEKRFELEKKPY